MDKSFGAYCKLAADQGGADAPCNHTASVTTTAKPVHNEQWSAWPSRSPMPPVILD
jgi:hypothetical protein